MPKPKANVHQKQMLKLYLLTHAIACAHTYCTAPAGALDCDDLECCTAPRRAPPPQPLQGPGVLYGRSQYTVSVFGTVFCFSVSVLVFNSVFESAFSKCLLYLGDIRLASASATRLCDPLLAIAESLGEQSCLFAGWGVRLGCVLCVCGGVWMLCA